MNRKIRQGLLLLGLLLWIGSVSPEVLLEIGLPNWLTDEQGNPLDKQEAEAFWRAYVYPDTISLQSDEEQRAIQPQLQYQSKLLEWLGAATGRNEVTNKNDQRSSAVNTGSSVRGGSDNG